MSWYRFLPVLLCLVACCPPEIVPDSAECLIRPWKTQNTILVVIDGPRYSETWGDPEKSLIPYMADSLAGKSVIGTEFYNLGNTYTIPGHISLMTGSYEFKDNNGSQYPLLPSFLQLYLSCTGESPDKAWIVTSKKKLEVLGDCESLAYRNKYIPSIDAVDRNDREVLSRTREIMEVNKPHLMLVHFKGPDYEAHHANWNGYLASIRETDSLLYELISFCEAQEFYRGKTSVIMTNDHGRHLDGIATGYVDHGDQCTGCTHLNFMAYGPDFKNGYISDRPAQSIDILPTIGVLMGYRVPWSNGRVLDEIFN